jgi:excinuclease UvrABC ATPase subunit
LGPKAGEQGGQIMFANSLALLKDDNSLTAAYLAAPG